MCSRTLKHRHHVEAGPWETLGQLFDGILVNRRNPKYLSGDPQTDRIEIQASNGEANFVSQIQELTLCTADIQKFSARRGLDCGQGLREIPSTGRFDPARTISLSLRVAHRAKTRNNHSELADIIGLPEAQETFSANTKNVSVLWLCSLLLRSNPKFRRRDTYHAYFTEASENGQGLAALRIDMFATNAPSSLIQKTAPATRWILRTPEKVTPYNLASVKLNLAPATCRAGETCLGREFCYKQPTRLEGVQKRVPNWGLTWNKKNPPYRAHRW